MPTNPPKKLTIFENYLLNKDKIKKSLRKFKERNKKKISFMFIPHDENHIYKLELSFFMLYFLILMSILLVLLSVLYFFTPYFDSDKSEIYSLNKRNTAIFLLYENMNEELSHSSTIFKNQTDELNQIAWGISQKDLLGNNSIQSDPNSSFTQDSISSDIFQGIVDKTAKLVLFFKKLMPEFQNAAGYLHARESLFNSLPKGRPLKPGIGFVTSTFGFRIDPFGLTESGEFHAGIDFASGEGTPIYATAPGIVAKFPPSVGGLGNAVKINHINGIYTLYGHCSAVLVKEGDVVQRGDKIGLVGSTGKATGSHVHYEVRNGSDPPLDPVEFINLE